MLYIKFEKKPIDDEDPDTSLYIVVDGISDLKSYCYEEMPGKWIARIYNEGVFERLCSYDIPELANYFSRITYVEDTDNSQLATELSVHFANDDIEFAINIWFSFRVELWAKPYGIQTFCSIFRGLVEGRKIDGVSYEQEDELGVNGFGIWVAITDQKQVLKHAVDSALSIFKDLKTSAEATAIDALDRENLVTMFSFPDRFRVACKQYLVYFAQFLIDLGVEADTEIKDEGDQTLFKVIPQNKFEALETIREALNTYLNAPAITDLEVQEQFISQDVAVMQWQANIMHLKSQLMLANSAIQMKDATIDALRLTNYQYHQLALQSASKEHVKNEEDVVPGILAVKPLEGKGFSLNLPEILRRLKRRFGGRNT